MAIDANGNFIVADAFNNRIRKVTPSGNVSTLAGSGSAAFAEGTGVAASFNSPSHVCIGTDGTIYVADSYNHRIRKVTPLGVVTTLAGSGSNAFADGMGAAASFDRPRGVAVDSSNNVFVADLNNNRIRKITSAGLVSTLAGNETGGWVDGTGSGASFYQPIGICINTDGNIYVADYYNNRIRKVTTTGVVTTVAGGAGNGTNGLGLINGIGQNAAFNAPHGLTADPSGNLIVADTDNHCIRKVTIPGGVVTTLAGSGIAAYTNGNETVASFNYPVDVTMDSSGNIYVADNVNHRIRKIQINTNTAPTLIWSLVGYIGYTGPTGQGVPTGGSVGQVLAKNSPNDYDTHWITLSGGGGGSAGIQIYTGSQVPASNLGNTNDLYINTTSKDLYKKGFYGFSSQSLLLNIDNKNDQGGVGIAINSANQDIYVVDVTNTINEDSIIKKYSPTSSTSSVLITLTGPSISSLVINSTNTFLYTLHNKYNNYLLAVNISTQTSTKFNMNDLGPSGGNFECLTIDINNKLIVTYSNYISLIDVSGSTFNSFSSIGSAPADIKAIAVDSTNTYLYTCSETIVYKILISDTSQYTTIATGFTNIRDIKINNNGILFISDKGNNSLVQINISTGEKAIILNSANSPNGYTPGYSMAIDTDNTAVVVFNTGVFRYNLGPWGELFNIQENTFMGNVIKN